MEDEKRLADLELAANRGQIDEKIIFNIYKQFSFNLNTLLNAKNIYQTLRPQEARALMYKNFFCLKILYQS